MSDQKMTRRQKRQERRAARRNAGPTRRMENYTPPEGVPIAFEIASVGSRYGAQFMDILITFGGLGLLIWLLAWIDIMDGAALFTFFILAAFLLRIPYYIIAELVWNGRTLGKSIVGLRVVSADGRRLTPYQITARNLMKEVELFMPIATFIGASFATSITIWIMVFWMIAVVIVPFTNRRRQRIGDMIAGTIVVDRPKAALLPDLTEIQAKRATTFAFETEHLDVYGRFELQTLENILRHPPKGPDGHDHIRKITDTILNKINYPERVLPNQRMEFLLDFYTQQREYLESKHLFGDSRENKFHDADRGDAA